MSIYRKAAAAAATAALLVSSTAYAAAPVRSSASIPTASASTPVPAANLRKSAAAGEESQFGAGGFLAIFAVIAIGLGLYFAIDSGDSDG